MPETRRYEKRRVKVGRHTYSVYLEHIVDTWEGGRDSYWVVSVPKLLGCISHAPTRQSALVHIKDAIRVWTRAAREMGWTFNCGIPVAVHLKQVAKT